MEGTTPITSLLQLPPKPRSTEDKLYILCVSAILSITIYKSMEPGFRQKGVSLIVFSAGTLYAFEINYEYVKHIFDTISKQKPPPSFQKGQFTTDGIFETTSET